MLAIQKLKLLPRRGVQPTLGLPMGNAGRSRLALVERSLRLTRVEVEPRVYFAISRKARVIMCVQSAIVTERRD